MIGAVIGDIAGSVYEFRNTRDYDFKMFAGRSNFTDDTIVSMAVARWVLDGISRGGVFAGEALAYCMVSYAREFPAPMGGYGHSFHDWLFNPRNVVSFRTGRHLNGREPYYSCGNGSAMRVSAVGWAFGTLEETERVAGISASVTHDHPEGIKGAQAVASAIYMARRGSSKDDIRRYVESRYKYSLDDSWKHLNRNYRWDSTCQGTVPQALVAFMDSSDFESAVRMAVSMGGDSDTLACITGAVAEAFYREIPEYMYRKAMSLLPGKFKQIISDIMKIDDKIIVREYTPDNIVSLRENEVFVFGSNLRGQHGGGAARVAYQKFGAEWGVGVGMTGQCYAIPTMQGGVETIRPYVSDFIAFARMHSEYRFLVTRIGCGIAGFRDEDIAPLFRNALKLDNVVLPESFCRVLLG